MKPNLSATDQAFERQVVRFVQRYGPKVDESWRTRAVQQRWQARLTEYGWSVPSWPKQYGGPDWTPTQKYLWYRTCARAMSGYAEPDAIARVGPLLIQWGSQAQQDEYLAEIRTFAQQWCVGYVEPMVGTDLRLFSTTVAHDGEGWHLNGCKVAVFDAQYADKMCCLVCLKDRMSRDESGQRFAFVIVDMHSPGLTLHRQQTLDGESVFRVEFEQVHLAPNCIIGPVGHGGQHAALMDTHLFGVLGRSGVVGAQLELLQQQMRGLAEEDELQRRVSEAEIELVGLEALEIRFTDALQHNLPMPFPLTLLRIRASQLEEKMGTLLVESFGYYALPYPDEITSHNESEIGPERVSGAKAASRSRLAQLTKSAYMDTSLDLQDQLARVLKL
ncbi:MAG: hypothetical protein GXP16_16790 [Gammaproteobacteria bacterium]|nr:hypothetical protein [Gammaproteobacteria bacterium]